MEILSIKVDIKEAVYVMRCRGCNATLRFGEHEIQLESCDGDTMPYTVCVVCNHKEKFCPEDYQKARVKICRNS